jgi:hypothetical protein
MCNFYFRVTFVDCAAIVSPMLSRNPASQLAPSPSPWPGAERTRAAITPASRPQPPPLQESLGIVSVWAGHCRQLGFLIVEGEIAGGSKVV